MIKTWLVPTEDSIVSGKAELISQWRHKRTAKIWIDVHIDKGDDASVVELLESFGVHPLAIKDALRDRHPPKLENFDDHLFILYRGVQQVEDELLFDHQQIAYFIGERFLISVHRGHSVGIDKNANEANILQHLINPLYLACKIMHSSAAIYLDELLKFEQSLEEVENSMNTSGNDQTLAKITSYKSRLVKLSRVFNYHTRITDELKTSKVFSKEMKQALVDAEHTLNDLHDRFDRLLSLSKMHYDICGDLMDGYLSISSHNLNNTMRVLTVITAVFVPLSFLAGLYGMNFQYMPELGFKYAYFVLLAVMFITGGALITFFKRKNWF
ncbi:magnesium transporter CorA family protein [Algibacillus agarilyticus]|uniref:magnesium transporter CorA family protein n=1 Tax=Algibacillus agarilyticus TaxID=2234133 RepID=UPI000DD06F08|nr:magnesium transporter CorA family protein [Algibacillus agarilyticus]